MKDNTEFSTKCLMTLNKGEKKYYVYGLMDPYTKEFFYIGKGTGNRIFSHEREAKEEKERENQKIRHIKEITKTGNTPMRVLLNYNLTEQEAFAAEAALIGALNFRSRERSREEKNEELTNIVAGHGMKEAITIESFEKNEGAEELKEKEVKEKCIVIKINKTYDELVKNHGQNNISDDMVYEVVRGTWYINIKRAKKSECVLAVYNSLIVGVYMPKESDWYVLEENKEGAPKHALSNFEKDKKRKFFVDDERLDSKREVIKEKYLYKSIESFKLNKKAQNPITYINM